ncbi:hypothetical protein [Natrinema marinum]|uniref:hypothetical protein n=1 Tax=Natrinema marinum TaxID=2961598 RepID=UPI0020C8F1A5|nr:hypothetical protein [Natrinema marinum]
MTRPASDRTDGAPTRRKATLFCWECDYAAPIEGDWELRSQDRHVAYVCPVCGTTLAERPCAPSSAPGRLTPKPITAWQRAVCTSVTIWRASVDIGLSSLAALVGVRSTTERQRRHDIS